MIRVIPQHLFADYTMLEKHPKVLIKKTTKVYVNYNHMNWFLPKANARFTLISY